jgi:ribosomal protein S18 acetylase RimI-like enzyme
MISLAGGQTVGFLSVRKNSRHDNKHLDLLAICPAYRNQGIGSNVLEHVMSGLPNSGQLIVHCTKYARSMQHILKRHKFKRNVKFDVPTLEEYRSQSVSVDPS